MSLFKLLYHRTQAAEEMRLVTDGVIWWHRVEEVIWQLNFFTIDERAEVEVQVILNGGTKGKKY